MLFRSGLAVARRAAGEPLTRATAVYVADTLGELGLWYRLAGIAFVGGSLVPHGGQNMLEPARLGCAVLCGPHTWNFAAIVAEMRAASALLPVGDAAELANTVAALLANPRRREEAGEAAARYGRDEARVLDRVTAALSPLLDAATGRD